MATGTKKAETAYRNSRLLAKGQEHNVWPQDGGKPFTPFPAWWRRFVFRSLTAPEIAVYLAVCCHVGPEGVAYMSLETLRHELGRGSTKRVKAHLARLIELGFLLKAGKYQGHDVYQRPSIHHTLATLLEHGEIGWDLYHSERTDERHDPPHRLLKKLLKPLEGENGKQHPIHDLTKPGLTHQVKDETLRQLLSDILRQMRVSADVQENRRKRPRSRGSKASPERIELAP